MKRFPILRWRCAGLWLALASVTAADSAPTTAVAEPTIDRWNYGHNATPGYRAKGSLFTGLPGDVDGGADRLGQIVLGFDTVAMGVPAEAPPASYHLNRVTVTARVANNPDVLRDPPLIYDPSVDPFDAALPGGTDPDAGQPVELHGTGFRNGFTPQTYVEGAPPSGLGEPGLPGTAYSGPEGVPAYPLGFDESGAPRDVTNNASEGFAANPWATGETDLVQAGDSLPVDTVLKFDLDLDQPGVRRYVQGALAEGMLFFTLSSLQPASFDDGSSGRLAIFYLKESLEHQLFGDSAPTLELDYELVGKTEIAMEIRYERSSNELLLTWGAEAGAVYEVLTSIDLEAWTSLAEVVAAVGGPLDYRAPLADEKRRFYRIRRKSS